MTSPSSTTSQHCLIPNRHISETKWQNKIFGNWPAWCYGFSPVQVREVSIIRSLLFVSSASTRFLLCLIVKSCSSSLTNWRRWLNFRMTTKIFFFFPFGLSGTSCYPSVLSAAVGFFCRLTRWGHVCFRYHFSFQFWEEAHGDSDNVQTVSLIFFFFSVRSSWSSMFLQVTFANERSKRGEVRACWGKTFISNDHCVQRSRVRSKMSFKKVILLYQRVRLDKEIPGVSKSGIRFLKSTKENVRQRNCCFLLHRGAVLFPKDAIWFHYSHSSRFVFRFRVD